MSTGDKKVNIYLKKFLPRDQMVENFQDLVQKFTEDLYARLYSQSGIFSGGDLSSSAVDTFDISTPNIATNSEGKDMILDPSEASLIPFQNTNLIDYFVGLRQNIVPDGAETNVRTGKLKYIFFKEIIGERADPDVVVDDTDGTMTIRVNSVTEAGVSNAGRKVLVFLKATEDGGGVGPQSLITPIEELTVQFDGSNNFVETVTGLGQVATNISTDVNDYEVILIGPTVKRNTDLRTIPEIAFLGIVTGAGSGSSPTSFDQTDRVILSSLTPSPGTGLLAQLSTLLEEGGTVTHDDSVAGRMTWSSDLKIRPFGTSDFITVSAASIDLADDEVAFIELPDPFVTSTLPMQKAARSSAGLTSLNRFWIFHRHGVLVAARGGLQFEQGEQRQLDDIVIGNAVFFSNDDAIRYIDSDNTYHFDADGGSDNADLVIGSKVNFGNIGNNDLFRFVSGGTPSYQFLLDNIQRFSINEDGDSAASRDFSAVRDISAGRNSKATGDSLDGSATAYSTATGSLISTNASLNETHDLTLNRRLFRPTPNSPNDRLINIAPSTITLADGSLFTLSDGTILSNYTGGTANFNNGTVTGGGASFTVIDFTGQASQWAKYSVNLLNDDTISVLSGGGFGATQAAALDPPLEAGALASFIVAVQDNGSAGVGTIENIAELNFERLPASGGAAPPGNDTEIIFNDGGVFGANSAFIFDKSTGNLGVGTAVNNTEGRLNVLNSSGDVTLGLFRFSDGQFDGASLRTFRSRGTEASPTAILSGDRISEFRTKAFDGTSFEQATRIRFQATENWAVGANGASMTFQTTANGDTGFSNFTIYDQNGNWGIGTTSPLASLDVRNGGIRTENAVDGQFVALDLQNSQASAGGSTNETIRIDFNHAGLSAGGIIVGRESDYTSAANEDAFMAFNIVENGIDGEAMRITSDRTILLLKGLLKTFDDAVADATPTADMTIKSGDKSAGTGDSGDVVLQPGISVGGTRGTINFLDGSEGTSAHVWTSKSTGGQGNWAPLPGGSGGISGEWRGNALDTEEFDERVFKFQSPPGVNILTMYVKVPQSYVPGSQIKTLLGLYSPSASNRFRMLISTILIKKGVDAIDTTTNVNVANTGDIINTVANQYREGIIDLTDVDGEINSVAVSPGDLLKLLFTRTTATVSEDSADVRFVPSSTEVNFG